MQGEHNVRWRAAVSDGTFAEEGHGEYKTVPGAMSPWGRFLLFLEREGRVITALCLVADDGRVWNLPAVGKNPTFSAFALAPRPSAYRMFRRLGQDIIRGDGRNPEPDVFTCIEAAYPDGMALQVWVNEISGASWSLYPKSPDIKPTSEAFL